MSAIDTTRHRLETLSRRVLGRPKVRSGPLAGDRPSEPDPLAVNGHEVLDKVMALPISSWHYRDDPPGIRHLGPMAQDFAAAFGLGSSDRWIDMVDANGVCMVAIQALCRRVQSLEDQLAVLRQAT